MDNNNPTKKAKRRNGGVTTAVTTKPRHSGHRTHNGRVRKTRPGRVVARARSNGEMETTQGGRLVEYECRAPWEDAERYTLWPIGLVYVVYVVTLTSRVWVVSNPANWWVLHPDEVFQSLEVAHSEVYGYGFRPYEFLPPHTPGTGMTSLADKQEAEMGMYSLRSWLYPRLFMAVFHINDYLGGSQSPFLVGKVFHAVVASHLPVAVYFFTSFITRSHDIGHSATILVSFSEHLMVLGTHTLVNSFLSPALFATLAILYSLIIDDSIISGDGASDVLNGDTSSGDSDSAAMSCAGTPTKDVNGNAKSQLDHAEKVDAQSMMHSNRTFTDSNENLDQEYQFEYEDGVYITVGIILSLLCYVRVDLIVFLAVIGLVFFTDLFLHPIKHTKHVMSLMFGAAVGVIIGGLDDLYSYGNFLMSPIQWFKFNILTDLPNIFFGWDSSWTYVEFILNYNAITQLQTLLLTFTFVFSIYRLLFVDDTLSGRHLNKCLLRLVLATILLFVIYSLKGHKEVRFLHNVIVLFQISSALSLAILFRWLIDAIPGWRHTIKLHGRLMFALFTISLLLNFPTASDRSNQMWAYKGVWDSNHINQCLDFIRRQPDASGLFSDRSIHETAAYSVLHKDIPIFSLFHNDFMEFDETVRKILPSNDFFSTRDAVSVTVASQISNFISTENSPLLLKALVAEPTYNYMVLKTARRLVHTGFDEVFRSGTMRVMRRSQDENEATELQQIADSIPIGRNATVLEYEGSWLMTFGLRQLAMERLEAATDLDPSRVRTFQLLALIYRDVGRTQDAHKITARCYHQNSKARCMEIQPKVVLYPDYLS